MNLNGWNFRNCQMDFQDNGLVYPPSDSIEQKPGRRWLVLPAYLPVVNGAVDAVVAGVRSTRSRSRWNFGLLLNLHESRGAFQCPDFDDGFCPKRAR